MYEEYNVDQEIETLEISIKQAEGLVALGEAVERLEKNPDFLLVIGETFLRREALRMLDMSSDPRTPENMRELMMRDIHAPAALKRFLEAMVKIGMNAKEAIKDAEEQIEELQGIVPETDDDGDEE